MKMGFQKTGYAIPAAIIVAGLLIAGAFFAANGGESADRLTANSHGGSADAFRMPDDADHVRGNPDAAIAIVEFSDLECPFCARIHPTLTRIVEEQDDVKWVFRHFPLTTIHSNALSAAIASECIAQLSGEDAFWAFTDAAFENGRVLSDSWYEEMARSFGINQGAFGGCINDQSIVADIQADFNEARNAGGRGTPYVVIVTSSGELMPFSGALPYQQVVALIEQARNN